MAGPMRWAAAGVLVLLAAGCAGTAHQARPQRSAAAGAGTHVVTPSPVGLTADAGGHIWVVGVSAGTLTRLGSHAVEQSVSVGDTPLRVAADADSLWVSVFGAGVIAQVDPAAARVVGTVAVGAEPEGIVAAFGSVWVVLQKSGQLVRINPATRAVVSRIRVGSGSRLVTAGADALWVSNFTTGTLTRVDPRVGTTRGTPKVCNGPQGMLPAADLVWVACTTDGTLVSVNPATGRPATTVRTGGEPDALAAGPGGLILVALTGGPTLITVDPRTAAVTGRRPLGQAPPLRDRANVDLVVRGRVAWVSSYFEGRVYRTGV
ncbi:MAG: hypothetical protein M3042_02880 [Actinomycetota bacterium]|nr:hypothetical protein [Actinomycetota bacterium]